MIRMNQKMLARAREQTDRVVMGADPSGALLEQVNRVRALNGALPFKEHDFQALFGRNGGANGGPNGGPTLEAIGEALILAVGDVP